MAVRGAGARGAGGGMGGGVRRGDGAMGLWAAGRSWGWQAGRSWGGQACADLLEALLEVAAELGAGDHRAEVEGEQARVPQGFGAVA